MRKGFVVTVNNQIVLECANARSPARLRRYFEEMDADMDKGIQLSEEWVEKPELYQKQLYVSMLLIRCIDAQETNQVKLLQNFIADRYSELSEIRVTQHDEDFSLQLINN